MQVQSIDGMFRFVYMKSSAEIVTAAQARALAISDRREKRVHRLTQLREEYGIDDAALSQIFISARAADRAGARAVSYTSNKRQSDGTTVREEASIGAGVVNMLLTENDYVEGERAQIDRLHLICRNLADVIGKDGKPEGHRLDEEELRFLGF